MKINNSREVAEWEKLDPNSEEYKKCKIAWNSVPQEDFVIEEPDRNENGDILESGSTHEKTVKEITLKRGTNEKVLGWAF